MTTTSTRTVRCCCCQQVSKQTYLTSFTTGEGVDLDGRPHGLFRATMPYWCQVCPGCGYAAAGLDCQVGDVKFVHTQEYQSVRADADYPPLANCFRLSAMLNERAGAVYALQAATDWQAAAWVCDDAQLQRLATACRVGAAAQYQRCVGDPDAGDLTLNTAVMASRWLDTVRRAGLFTEARRIASVYRELLSRHGPTKAVMEFEMKLIDAGDVSRHTLAKVLAAQE